MQDMRIFKVHRCQVRLSRSLEMVSEIIPFSYLVLIVCFADQSLACHPVNVGDRSWSNTGCLKPESNLSTSAEYHVTRTFRSTTRSTVQTMISSMHIISGNIFPMSKSSPTIKLQGVNLPIHLAMRI